MYPTQPGLIMKSKSKSHSLLYFRSEHFPKKVLRIIKMLFKKCKTGICVLFARSVFFHLNSLMDDIFLCSRGSFSHCFDESLIYFWKILVGKSFLGRFTAVVCQCFVYFPIMALTVVCWTHNVLEIVLHVFLSWSCLTVFLRGWLFTCLPSFPLS